MPTGSVLPEAVKGSLLQASFLDLGMLSSFTAFTSAFLCVCLPLCLNVPFHKDTVIRVLLLVAQSCPTLRDRMDGSPPGSSVPGILQARTLEWVAIPFSRGSS